MMTIAETVNIDALKARYERIARAGQDAARAPVGAIGGTHEDD